MATGKRPITKRQAQVLAEGRAIRAANLEQRRAETEATGAGTGKKRSQRSLDYGRSSKATSAGSPGKTRREPARKRGSDGPQRDPAAPAPDRSETGGFLSGLIASIRG